METIRIGIVQSLFTTDLENPQTVETLLVCHLQIRECDRDGTSERKERRLVMNSHIVEVESIWGLYDEVEKHQIYDINDRGICMRHNWINGLLGCRKRTAEKIWSTDILGHEFGDILPPALKTVRFCSHCKRIDCFHYWDEEIVYKIPFDRFEWAEHTINQCSKCRLRILVRSQHNFHATDYALDFIKRIAGELHINWTGNPQTSSAFGSNYFTVFPSAVSRLIESSGKELAESYVKQVFQQGHCL